MEKIAKTIWDKIRWISLTNKELDEIILSEVGEQNKNIVKDIKKTIHKISYEEAKEREYIEEHISTTINEYGYMEIIREALAQGRYPLAAEDFYMTIIPEVKK